MDLMRERLIELIEKGQFNYYASNGSNGIGHNEYIADYLLANGVIVPPCKVGDTVYIAQKPHTSFPLKKVVEGTIISIHLHEFGLLSRAFFDTKEVHCCRDYNFERELGKTVFLTKEEAEAELRKEDDGK